MKISIGCDHGGYELKMEIIEHLRERGIEVKGPICEDVGEKVLSLYIQRKGVVYQR